MKSNLWLALIVVLCGLLVLGFVAFFPFLKCHVCAIEGGATFAVPLGVFKPDWSCPGCGCGGFRARQSLLRRINPDTPKDPIFAPHEPSIWHASKGAQAECP